MAENKCEYLAREGVCCAALTVCCKHQNGSKFFRNDDSLPEIKSIRETYCDYPNIPDQDYAKVIEDLARHMAGDADGKTV